MAAGSHASPHSSSLPAASLAVDFELQTHREAKVPEVFPLQHVGREKENLAERVTVELRQRVHGIAIEDL